MDNDVKSLQNALDNLKHAVSKANEVGDVQKLCKTLVSLIPRMKSEFVNKTILDNLSISFVSWILQKVPNPLTKPIKDLLLFLVSKNLVLPHFGRILMIKYPQLVTDINITFPHAFDDRSTNKLELSFDELLKEKKMKTGKEIGISFVNIDGTFIYCDKKSEKLFELTKKKGKAAFNFFDPIIPYSKHLLKKKFGKELFNLNGNIGAMLSFIYVLYSKNAVKKYAHQLRAKGIKDKDSIDEKVDNTSIYFKYMKALSSRATLVCLKYNKDELIDLKENGCFMDFHKEGDNKFECTDKDKKRGNNKDIKSKDKINYKTAIMLETRPASKIPAFDYKNMLNDPTIVEFEDLVSSKLKNKYIRMFK